ncbi:PulJ/GspJ family protein [Rheinheimera sp.]|uniref:PulJ/GspJ family protein n=1 Tax=Rheinheimera sp. TaxID=1869214 RepID=UPI002FDF082A
MKQTGLTLIEVLIASVILFMTLGLVATVFQQSLGMQQRAIKHLAAAEQFPSLVSQIRFELEQQKTEGSIELNAQRYQWQATELKRAKELSSVDENGQDYLGNIGMLVLFNVTVTSQNGGTGFEFRQAIWLNSEV